MSDEATLTGENRVLSHEECLIELRRYRRVIDEVIGDFRMGKVVDTAWIDLGIERLEALRAEDHHAG